MLKQGGALISTLQEPDKAKALYKNLTIAHYMARPNADELAQIAVAAERFVNRAGGWTGQSCS